MRDGLHRGVLGVLGAALALALLTACDRSQPPLHLTGLAMGTTFSITITRLPNGVQGVTVETEVAGVLQSADEHLSGWNPSSELLRINAARGTDWVPVSPELFGVLEQARLVSRDSAGAFDVTVGPVVRVWGFGAAATVPPMPPSDEELQQLLTRVGYAQFELREHPMALRKAVPGLEFDLDGIAPGWAVDRIAERLDALGIDDYLIELGGEVRGRGQSPGRRAWRVAVEEPVAGERRARTVVEIDGTGVSTSGDYRDFRDVGGRRISHTIDPRSGRPVTHGLASVTVVHDSVAAADAWATALMVLGREEGAALAQRRGLAALFVERGAAVGEFAETQTPQFARLRLTHGAGL